MTAQRIEKLTGWLRSQATIAGARGFVVGLSGGIDSAVVVRLCQFAAPDGVLGVLLPCHSDPRDEEDALLVARHFDVPTVRIDLSGPFDALVTVLGAAREQPALSVRTGDGHDGAAARMAHANLKPRLRMTSLYFLANQLNYLVVGTGNRCELTIGYFTKYGDGGVDLLPIGRLLKSDVRDIARELGVPSAIIDKPPSAGLWQGQTDEGDMGFTYAELEGYLTEGPESVAPALALKIERLMRQTEHKRRPVPIPEPD